MDRRRNKRIVKRLAVNFGPDEMIHTGITHDISETGLFIRTTKIYSAESILKINLQIPSNGSMFLTGRVVRTYKHPPFASLAHNGVGVEFESSEESYLTFISGLEG